MLTRSWVHLCMVRKKMRDYGRFALKSYTALNKEEEVSRKRKLAMEDIAEVKQRKANIEECVGSLEKEADELSILAEKKQDFTALAKANSFRAAQKDKRDEIMEFEKVIDKMELALKQFK